MARVSVIDPKSATGEAATLLQAVQAQLGATPNFIRVLANSPKALAGFLGLYGAAGGFAIDKATQERIALAVAEGNGCQYCVSAHTAIGRHAGLTERGDAAEPPGHLVRREGRRRGRLRQGAQRQPRRSDRRRVRCRARRRDCPTARSSRSSP